MIAAAQRWCRRQTAGRARVISAPTARPLWACTTVAFLFAAVGAGCTAPPLSLPPAANVHDKGVVAGPVVTSNILRDDYAGSEACVPCHSDVVAAWRRSPMHQMTRLPEGAVVRAPFDGREFAFKNDVARFEQVGTTRFVRLRSASNGEHLYRVTKVIGGRIREDFAGVEVASTDPHAPVLGDGHTELILPASYVFETQSFRLKGYSVMVGERPGMRAGGVWNQTCIFCHNTVPYFDDLWGAIHGPGGPSYQGEVVDRALPVARRMTYAVTDTGALTRALDHELSALRGGGPGTSPAPSSPGGATDGAGAGDGGDDGAGDGVRAALRRAMAESRARFAPEHFVEVGIGCEACHGGARAHVDDPRVHPSFEPRAPFLSVVRAGVAGAGAGVSKAEWQNRACARCHQVLFSRYLRTWEGGSRRTPASAGGSHITSGEGRDFLLGACASAMTCTACHDPHGEDSREKLARLATPAGNGVCTGCHQKLGGVQALADHAHHDPRGAGGACIACHMPKKNMSLGYGLTRYHRIGSPTDVERVERDRPLECALCHADKTVRALLADIARLWGKRYDPASLERLYGSLDANVLLASIERGYAHEQAAAMGTAGEQHMRLAAPAIAREREGNAYPLVRLYAGAALAALEGKALSSDPAATGTTTSGPTGVPLSPTAGTTARSRSNASPRAGGRDGAGGIDDDD